MSAAPPHEYHPTLEALEDRLLLSGARVKAVRIRPVPAPPTQHVVQQTGAAAQRFNPPSGGFPIVGFTPFASPTHDLSLTLPATAQTSPAPQQGGQGSSQQTSTAPQLSQLPISNLQLLGFVPATLPNLNLNQTLAAVLNATQQQNTAHQGVNPASAGTQVPGAAPVTNLTQNLSQTLSAVPTTPAVQQGTQGGTSQPQGGQGKGKKQPGLVPNLFNPPSGGFKLQGFTPFASPTLDLVQPPPVQFDPALTTQQLLDALNKPFTFGKA